MQYAWHFGTDEDFHRAFRVGALSGVGMKHQRPVIWFSPGRRWQPTASRGGKFLSIDECRNAGLCRFGYPARSLITGVALRHAAKISPVEWELLCAQVRVLGGGPQRWYGHVGHLPIADLIIDRLHDDEWHRLSRAQSANGALVLTLKERPLGEVLR